MGNIVRYIHDITYGIIETLDLGKNISEKEILNFIPDCKSVEWSGNDDLYIIKFHCCENHATASKECILTKNKDGRIKSVSDEKELMYKYGFTCMNDHW